MLKIDPHGGAVFAFRGKRGDLVKLLWWDGQGLCLFAKRLERGPLSTVSNMRDRALRLSVELQMIIDPHR
jgi:transposase